MKSPCCFLTSPRLGVLQEASKATLHVAVVHFSSLHPAVSIPVPSGLFTADTEARSSDLASFLCKYRERGATFPGLPGSRNAHLWLRELSESALLIKIRITPHQFSLGVTADQSGHPLPHPTRPPPPSIDTLAVASSNRKGFCFLHTWVVKIEQTFSVC